MSTTATTLVRESGLYNGSTYAVLLEMADCANHECSGIFPSVDTIAEYSRMSVRQAQRRIGELEADGILMRDISGAGRGGRAQWRLNVEKLTAARVVFMAKREVRSSKRRRVKKVTDSSPIRTIEKVTSASPFAEAEKVTAVSPFPDTEKVTSSAQKGDIQRSKKVTPSAKSASASLLYDPSKDLDPYGSSNPQHQTVENSTANRPGNRTRKCTHGKCGPDGCSYEFERVDFNRILEQVEMRAALARSGK